MGDVLYVLGVALGVALGQLVRLLSRTRFWSVVASNARRMLADPHIPVTDPEKAAERALLDAQRTSVRRVARSLSRAPVSEVRTHARHGSSSDGNGHGHKERG